MMLCIVTAVLTLAWAKPAMAEVRSGEQRIYSQWIDMNKGPGVARWVDENGTVSEETGIKTEENQQPEYIEEPGMQDTIGAEDQSGNGQEVVFRDPFAIQEADGTSVQEQTIIQEIDTTLSQEPVAVQGTDITVTQNQVTTGRVIDPNRPMVALTFDDGPYAPVGNRIMDCAAQYGAKLTFYVVGNRCAAYQTEMQRMAAEGHEIGNHTYEHKYLNKLGAGEIQYQVNKGSEAILAASGIAPGTVRLPGGNKNAIVLANINAPIIMWSIDTLDWKTRDAKSTVEKVLGNVRDGDIVLMHELYNPTGDAALQIIPALVEQGYQLVTVSEMAQYRGGLQNGVVYSAFRP